MCSDYVYKYIIKNAVALYEESKAIRTAAK